MKRITFTCDDTRLIQVMTMLVPHIQTLIVEDMEPMKVLPRLEAPPPRALNKDGTVRKIRKREGPHRDPNTPPPQKVQATIKSLGRNFERGFKLWELFNASHADGSKISRKVLSNNVNSMVRSHKVEVIGGDKQTGFIYKIADSA